VRPLAVSLTVAVRDPGPSGSLILARKNFPFSASYRFMRRTNTALAQTTKKRASDEALSLCYPGLTLLLHGGGHSRTPLAKSWCG
jgi:hypothetical protein